MLTLDLDACLDLGSCDLNADPSLLTNYLLCYLSLGDI